MPATVVLGTAAAGAPMTAANLHPPSAGIADGVVLAGAGRGSQCTQRCRSGRPLRPCSAAPSPARAVPQPGCRRGRPAVWPAAGLDRVRLLAHDWGSAHWLPALPAAPAPGPGPPVAQRPAPVLRVRHPAGAHDRQARLVQPADPRAAPRSPAERIVASASPAAARARTNPASTPVSNAASSSGPATARASRRSRTTARLNPSSSSSLIQEDQHCRR